MTILLAGDIGGTKTILRLVQSEPTASLLPSLTTLHEHTYPSRDFPHLVPMVQHFMKEAAGLGIKSYPERACFGIAGAVIDNVSRLTNLGWQLDANDLQGQLKIPQIKLINDFEAIGYGVIILSPDEIHTLQAGEPDPQGPIAILGAGTGLGQGYAIPYKDGFRVFATEGGHVDFAPRSELEYELLHYLKERLNVDRISVERVVSGTGIVGIYQFLRDRGVAESPEVAEVYKTWQSEMGKEQKTVNLAAVISKHATERTDYLCEETMDIFISAYGAEAGNMALKFLPYGGLYIAGGVAAKNLPLMQRDLFMDAFLSKGRVTAAVEKIPVHIILNMQVGLLGAALCAAQM